MTMLLIFGPLLREPLRSTPVLRSPQQAAIQSTPLPLSFPPLVQGPVMASISVTWTIGSPCSCSLPRAIHRLQQPCEINSFIARWEIGRRSDGIRPMSVPISVTNRLAVTLEHHERRKILLISAIGCMIGTLQNSLDNQMAVASEFADMPALRGKDYGKTKMRYPDYMETQSGLQYKDLRVGDGPPPKSGDTVVVDWDGYTIGYYGRIFEARNKTKGGSFEGDDKDFFKFKVGFKEVIPAFEEAIVGMAPGGIRRIIVPPELGYPDNDYNKLGPKPTTFSGQRALDFVLRNQGLIDKTLLFDIELLKVVAS